MGFVCRKAEEQKIGRKDEGQLHGHTPCTVTRSPQLSKELPLDQCCAGAILKSFTLEPGALHFHFALGLANDAAGLDRDSINLSISTHG